MAGNPPLPNGLLSRLPDDEWQRIRAHVEPFSFPAEYALHRAGDRYDAAYFPVTGLISLIGATEAGHHVEIVGIGAEGAVDATGLALRVARSPFDVIVSVPATGYRMAAEPFMRLFGELPAMQAVLLQYAGETLVGMGRSMACNRFHPVRQRLAKWLLLTRDKIGTPHLSITHDFLAQMLGGPRHAITAAMNELRVANAINYVRADIEVLDTAVLATYACECHALARSDTQSSNG